MLKFNNLKKGAAVANQGGAMEADTISKNGRSSKSQMSKVKKVACLFIACVAVCISVSAQSELTHSFAGNIRQNGKPVRTKQVKELMSANSEALKTFKTGNAITYTGVGLMFGGLGYVLFGDGDAKIGGAVFGVGLITGIVGESLRKKSVRLYNSKLNTSSIQYQINFGFTQTGIGVAMRF